MNYLMYFYWLVYRHNNQISVVIEPNWPHSNHGSMLIGTWMARNVHLEIDQSTNANNRQCACGCVCAWRSRRGPEALAVCLATPSVNSRARLPVAKRQA